MESWRFFGKSPGIDAAIPGKLICILPSHRHVELFSPPTRPHPAPFPLPPFHPVAIAGVLSSLIRHIIASFACNCASITSVISTGLAAARRHCSTSPVRLRPSQDPLKHPMPAPPRHREEYSQQKRLRSRRISIEPSEEEEEEEEEEAEEEEEEEEEEETQQLITGDA